jgi:hypothetical protein
MLVSLSPTKPALAGILGLNVAPVSADDSDADNNSATEIGELRENYVLGDG